MFGKMDIPYPGMGTLNSGGTGSPVQFILDMEIRKSQFALKDALPADEETLPIAEICRATSDGENFLSSQHTARNCRRLWTSRLFLTDNPDPGSWAGDEKGVLDSCDQIWRENLKNYQPPQWPDEKHKALEAVLASAKREFALA